MIKFVYCVRRRSDVSPERFRTYWLENHGPLVRSFAKALRAKKYIQSHTLVTQWDDAIRELRAQAAPYDGITEVWWERMEDLLEALQTPEGQEANSKLAADEGTFVDFERSCVFLTEEHVIFDEWADATVT